MNLFVNTKSTSSSNETTETTPTTQNIPTPTKTSHSRSNSHEIIEDYSSNNSINHYPAPSQETPHEEPSVVGLGNLGDILRSIDIDNPEEDEYQNEGDQNEEEVQEEQSNQDCKFNLFNLFLKLFFFLPFHLKMNSKKSQKSIILQRDFQRIVFAGFQENS